MTRAMGAPDHWILKPSAAPTTPMVTALRQPMIIGQAASAKGNVYQLTGCTRNVSNCPCWMAVLSELLNARRPWFKKFIVTKPMMTNE